METMHKDAYISACGKHRLWLTRTWDPQNAKVMVMCGLNPSTADASLDDPTIRRDLGFARREGCGGLIKINLHTFRATEPDDMFALRQSERNDERHAQVWKEMCCVDHRITVACWGADKRAAPMAREFVRFAKENGVELWCLGRSKDGQPRHPLYLPSATPLERFAA
jgi:hypothetical protein